MVSWWANNYNSYRYFFKYNIQTRFTVLQLIGSVSRVGSSLTNDDKSVANSFMDRDVVITSAFQGTKRPMYIYDMLCTLSDLLVWLLNAISRCLL